MGNAQARATAKHETAEEEEPEFFGALKLPPGEQPPLYDPPDERRVRPSVLHAVRTLWFAWQRDRRLAKGKALGRYVDPNEYNVVLVAPADESTLHAYDGVLETVVRFNATLNKPADDAVKHSTLVPNAGSGRVLVENVKASPKALNFATSAEQYSEDVAHTLKSEIGNQVGDRFAGTLERAVRKYNAKKREEEPGWVDVDVEDFRATLPAYVQGNFLIHAWSASPATTNEATGTTVMSYETAVRNQKTRAMIDIEYGKAVTDFLAEVAPNGFQLNVMCTQKLIDAVVYTGTARQFAKMLRTAHDDSRVFGPDFVSCVPRVTLDYENATVEFEYSIFEVDASGARHFKNVRSQTAPMDEPYCFYVKNGFTAPIKGDMMFTPAPLALKRAEFRAAVHAREM